MTQLKIQVNNDPVQSTVGDTQWLLDVSHRLNKVHKNKDYSYL